MIIFLEDMQTIYRLFKYNVNYYWWFQIQCGAGSKDLFKVVTF